MNKTAFLIVGALALALAAAAVLFWTDFIDVEYFLEKTPNPTSAASSREEQLVSAMNEAAAGNGFAASFLEADVGKWQASEAQRLERFSLGNSGPVFARLTSSTTLDKASIQWPSLGLSVTLPLAFATSSNGRRVEVGFVARSAQANGSPDLTVVYATQQAGNSGWKPFELQPDFQLFKFSFDVPKVDEGYANSPIIVFHSDAGGAGRAVEIIGLYVKLDR